VKLTSAAEEAVENSPVKKEEAKKQPLPNQEPKAEQKPEEEKILGGEEIDFEAGEEPEA
jgi:hypothetical protein